MWQTIELRSQRVLLVDHNDFPIRLLFVQESHDAQNLHSLDVTGLRDQFADFAHVERVIVTLGLGLGVNGVGVFPSLGTVRSAYKIAEQK